MEYISRSNFVEFEIEHEGFKLRLVKQGADRLPLASPPQLHAAVWPAQADPQAPAAIQPPPSATQPPPRPAAGREEDIYQVTAPMVGTFYRAPNPNAPPYVEVGAMVKKGQVLCIVEAMKLMNEIESEVSGEILEIPVANAQPVEYGEVLFRIRLTP